METITISELRQMNRAKGKHFFDKESMRFFNSKIHSRQAVVKDGYAFFITSEQFTDSDGKKDERGYTCRKMDLLNGSVESVTDFNKSSKAQATAKLKEVLKE